MRNKTLLIALFAGSMQANAQSNEYGDYAIYATDTVPIVIQPEHSSRPVVGGTVIMPQYGGGINNKMKNAFDYACHLWEEMIPTTYPLNFDIRTENLGSDSGILAVVIPANAEECVGKTRVYEKRVLQSSDNHIYLIEDSDYFERIDATIIFNSKAKFDYNIDPTLISPNKYDFITVAIQSIYKTLGYSLTESVDTSNHESLFMQPINSKGTAIRYIGNRMTQIFDRDEWSRERWIVVGSGGNDQVSGTTSNNVIPFGGSDSVDVDDEELILYQNKRIPRKTVREEMPDSFWDYYYDHRERFELGRAALTKDGRFLTFNSYSELETGNNEYAYTLDGHVRVRKVWRLPGWYYNVGVQYMLYQFYPQTPSFDVCDYVPSDWNTMRSSARTASMRSMRDEDEYYDVEIGFRFAEGCSYVLVEQTDSDWPVPYTYYVNPSEGSFIATMIRQYPSTFKLTYINEVGQTISLPKTIDISGGDDDMYTMQLMVNPTGNVLHYELQRNGVTSYDNQTIRNYRISSVSNICPEKNGQVIGDIGDINISEIPSGSYIISVNTGRQMVSAKWIKR